MFVRQNEPLTVKPNGNLFLFSVVVISFFENNSELDLKFICFEQVSPTKWKKFLFLGHTSQILYLY